MHGVVLAQGKQAQVSELSARGAPVRQFVQRAQVVPAEAGEVVDRLGVTGAGAKPQREVAAQIGADGGDREAAGRTA